MFLIKSRTVEDKGQCIYFLWEPEILDWQFETKVFKLVKSSYETIDEAVAACDAKEAGAKPLVSVFFFFLES